MAEANKGFPAEVVALPSRGWFYDPKSPLATGKVNLKFMSAAEEDILTSQNLIDKGVVLDRLIDALIVDKPMVQQEDLLMGDWDALMIGARVMGYGKIYETKVACPQCKDVSEQQIDLETLHDKDVEFAPEQKGKNEFMFTLPNSGQVITFKLLTRKDIIAAERELAGLSKLRTGSTKQITTRMRYSILSIDGVTEKKELAEAINNMMARDSMAWREYALKINPGIDMTFEFECPKCDYVGRVEVPINVNFFWPNAKV